MIKNKHPLIVFLFGIFFLQLFASLKFAGIIFNSDFSVAFFFLFSLILLIFLCVLFTIYFVKKYSFSEFYITKNDKKTSTITLGLVFVSFVVFINMINFSSTISDFHVYVLKIRDLKLFFKPFIPSLYQLILALICAPILEEILYRGILQKYLTKAMKKAHPLIPIAIASIVFSIFHLQFTKIPILFFSGFLFGYIYYKTQKIFIPIMAHTFWNLLHFLFIMDLQPMNHGNSFIFLIFMIVFVILTKCLYKFEYICTNH